MPSYDSARCRFRLAKDHLTLLSHLAGGVPVPAGYGTTAAELQSSGLVSEAGQVSVQLVPLLETLAEPVVAIGAEVIGRQGTLNHGLVIGQEHVFSHESWPGESEVEYAQVEPKLLVWSLARLVNLRQSDALDVGVPCIETTIGVMDAGLTALGSGAPSADADTPERIQQALAEAGDLTEPALSLFSHLLLELRVHWRVTSAWHGQDDTQPTVAVRGFGIWDCGPLGYWRRESPAEPVHEGQVGPDSPLVLRPVGSKPVWEMLADLLPEKEEIRRTA
ncbi:histidine kinase [Streptomyces sp. NPDC056061]|uniref:histidine kinase n=1 Tax=Streptomyces sp. NPDC056061 TaxID=3345700 RepID=UPI0035DC7460